MGTPLISNLKGLTKNKKSKMKVLQKISWKFRKTHITIVPLIIYINNTWEGWGFEFFVIAKELKEYSLLKLTWHLPNGAERKLKFKGDFLFLRTPLLKELDRLDDHNLWSINGLTKWEELKFSILNFLFR